MHHATDDAFIERASSRKEFSRENFAEWELSSLGRSLGSTRRLMPVGEIVRSAHRVNCAKQSPLLHAVGYGTAALFLMYATNNDTNNSYRECTNDAPP